MKRRRPLSDQTWPPSWALVFDDGKAVVPIDKYAQVFGGDLRAHQQRAKAGKWPNAHKLAGRWYVVVPSSALKTRLGLTSTRAGE